MKDDTKALLIAIGIVAAFFIALPWLIHGGSAYCNWVGGLFKKPVSAERP